MEALPLASLLSESSELPLLLDQPLAIKIAARAAPVGMSCLNIRKFSVWEEVCTVKQAELI